MKYLYTTDPDDFCHEIEGVYGRPAHDDEVKRLLAEGWKRHAHELQQVSEIEDEEEADESKENGQELTLEEKASLLGIDLFKDDGKKKHHKTLAKEIREAE